MKQSPRDKKLEEVLRSTKLVAGGFMGTDTRHPIEIIEADIVALSPRLVICLGDSFDDLAAARTLSEAVSLDYSRILHNPEVGSDVAIFNCEKQDHGLDKALDNKLIEQARPAGPAPTISTRLPSAWRATGSPRT